MPVQYIQRLFVRTGLREGLCWHICRLLEERKGNAGAMKYGWNLDAFKSPLPFRKDGSR